MTRQEMIEHLESVAATCRNVALGSDVTRFIEYQVTEAEARKYIEELKTNPAAEAPLSVASWSLASGLSEVEAATSIIATADWYNQMIVSIRHFRLVGKSQINSAPTDLDALNIYNTYLGHLKYIQGHVS